MDCFSSPAPRWLLGLRTAVFLTLLLVYNDESYYTLPPYDTARRAGSYGHDVRAGYLPGGRGFWEASPGPLGLHVVQFWSNRADRRTSLPRLLSALCRLPCSITPLISPCTSHSSTAPFNRDRTSRLLRVPI